MPNPVLDGVVIISLSSHHKLRLSKSKQCVHSHSASKNQDLNLGPLDTTIATALFILHYYYYVISNINNSLPLGARQCRGLTENSHSNLGDKIET